MAQQIKSIFGRIIARESRWGKVDFAKKFKSES